MRIPSLFSFPQMSNLTNLHITQDVANVSCTSFLQSKVGSRVARGFGPDDGFPGWDARTENRGSLALGDGLNAEPT